MLCRRLVVIIQPGMSVQELDTPALLVDLDRMERNIREWQAAVSANGVKLRPHVKTHKVPDIARMQLAAGAGGITVAKVAEAEVFAAGGAVGSRFPPRHGLRSRTGFRTQCASRRKAGHPAASRGWAPGRR